MDEWINFHNGSNVNVNLSIIKKSNTSYANVDDIVTYYLYAKNTGDYSLKNITIKDLLPNNIRFIKGSIQINNINMPDYSILAGIPIDNLSPDQELKISFDVETISMGNANNQAVATYEYSISPDKQPLIGLNYSNSYNLNISDAQLKVTKSSNKSEVSLNDIIEYSIKVSNTGNLNTFGVLLKDDLPRYLQLIPNSFSLNNNTINSVDLTSGVNIGDIPVGKSLNIKYKVKVISNPCNYQIKNIATTTYLYTLPDGTVGKGNSSIEKNVSIVNMRTSNFKQFGICEYLQIPHEKPDVEDINNVTGEIEIVRSHIITTPRIESLEGQILSGYKVIIHGVLNLIVEYTACDILQSVHTAHYAIPFSTFVVLPIDYVLGSKVSIHPVIEDVYSKCISCKTLFVDATSMINIKVLFC